MIKKNAKLIIFMSTLSIILIILASSFAFAYWSGDFNPNIENTDAPYINNQETELTYRYQRFKANIKDENNIDIETKCYLKYDDSGFFVTYKHYDEEEIPTDITTENIVSVTLFAYLGALGEYEALVIPSTIKIKINDVEKEVEVKYINMAMTQTSKDLFKEIRVPQTVTQIKESSFSGCNNLEKVYFEGAVPSIGANCFIGNPKNVLFYLDNTQTTITRS